MSDDYGSRPVTKADRERAVKIDLINSRSNVTFTPGMRRHLARRRQGLMTRLLRWLTGWLEVGTVLKHGPERWPR